MKIATVGTSGITELFISAAKKQGLEFTAAYSRDPARGQAFAEKHEMQASYSDLNAMAAADGFDAVYIASPNVFHYEQSRLFLERGKHVLCEKPMTSTLKQQDALTALAEANGRIYTEAIMSLHTPAFAVLKNVLPSIGRIRTANFVFCQLSSRYPAFLRGEKPNIFDPAMHAGCLMDIGVYNIYLAAALFGAPDRVSADAVFLDSGADASGTATLHYSDKIVNLIYSKVGQSYAPSEIVGDEGTVSIRSVSQLTGIDLITRNGLTNLISPDLDRDAVMGGEAAFFADAVKSGGGDAYNFAKQTARTVRTITDEIRAQLNFPF